MKFQPPMLDLPESGNPEVVREDVVTAVREVYEERALFDLGVGKLPSLDALNYAPVPACSGPVLVGDL